MTLARPSPCWRSCYRSQRYVRTTTGEPVIKAGPLTIDLASRRVYLEQERINLTRKEYQLLQESSLSKCWCVTTFPACCPSRVREAELHRLRGDLLNAIGDQFAAEQSYHQARAIAERQSAKLLCAATNLARLWRNQGKLTEAHNLLSAIYGWFTEGFDTCQSAWLSIDLERDEHVKQRSARR
jgi:hypothetical protein